MKRNFILTGILTIAVCPTSSATIIDIPDDYPTIQQGIDASIHGDTVLVQPGTYLENINFNGHNIVLGSLFLMTGDTAYISETIIDGDSSGSVVAFENAEDNTAELAGLTIRNGYAQDGGGIYCTEANPIIRNNHIVQNTDDRNGGGIYCYISSPSVVGNKINNNNGSGIFCHNSSRPLIYGNIFDGNSGGGIRCKTNSHAIIVHNLIVNNTTAYNGGGIYCDFSWLIIVNNTISGNYSDFNGGGIYHDSPYSSIIINSILWGDSARYFGQEIMNVFEVQYSNIQGGWEGEGNIDIDPLFRDPESGDFHVMSTACGDPYDSPCIDAGHPDILDSLLSCDWGLGGLRSDMGAYGGGDSVTVGIDDKEPKIPNRFALAQNYPNPFNISTIIRYQIPATSDVRIDIYDILGRKVVTLADEKQPAGCHQTIWNAEGGSSGIYFYKIKAGDFVETKRMMLLK